MLIYTKDQLSKMTGKELKSICKSQNLKGYSTLKKDQLVNFTYDNQPSCFQTPIQYVYNESLQMYSIVHLDTNMSIKDMTTLLIKHAAGKKVSDQTHSEKEIKALYRAGFRVRGQETLSEVQTLELLKNTVSIQMVCNTTKYNLIEEVAEVEPVQENKIINNEVTPNYSEDNTTNNYNVGNRTFNTIEKAEEYCISNDFDPMFMITKEPIENEIIESKHENNNTLYWYAYTLRGFSLGCQPDNFIKHIPNIYRHGIISYNRQLTNKELNDYELIPYDYIESLQAV